MEAIIHIRLASVQLDVPQVQPAQVFSRFLTPLVTFNGPLWEDHLRELHTCCQDF